MHRYQPLAFAWSLGAADNGNACRAILQKAKLTDWHIGKTKVFMRWYHPDELNELIKPIAGAATCFSKCARGMVARKRHRKLLDIKAEFEKQVRWHCWYRPVMLLSVSLRYTRVLTSASLVLLSHPSNVSLAPPTPFPFP